MAIDVTDATFQTDVLERSHTTPVVVDLWAPWCGPCKTLGPLLEQATDATEGRVVLAKVNVDENPEVAGAFRVQSIPAVYAVRDGQVVDGFVGAYPDHVVNQFVQSLVPSAEEEAVAEAVEARDEDALREALEQDPGNEEAVVALAGLLVERGDFDEALTLLARVPETEQVRQLAAAARLGASSPESLDGDVEARLQALLPLVRDDEDARREFVDLLEVMGPEDPRTAAYRRQLTSRLF